MIKRLILAAAVAAALVGLAVAPASAGSPHFIGSAFVTSVDGATLTVSGKEAGLGDEAQIHVVLTAEAQCVNPGGNHPQAGNKESFTAAGDFPVQNGKADFTLTVVAAFDPPCDPPMSTVFVSATVVDAANGLSQTVAL